MSEKKLKVLKSSAGSGKTYALVLEYLKLVLANSQNAGYYRHVLAITFTNAAAFEMKERVLSRLEGFSKEEPSAADATLLRELEQQLGVPVSELRERSRRVYTHMLHHYGQIAISTIDSFTHRIIRAFARDLRLHPDFAIELDADSLLSQVVDRLLDEVGTHPELTDYLERVVLTNVEDERNWNVRQSLVEFSKNLLSENGGEVAKSLAELSLGDLLKVREKLKSSNASFEKAVQEYGQSAVQVLQSAGVGIDMLQSGSRGIGNWYQKLAKGEVVPPSDAVVNSASEGKWIASKVKGAERDKVQAIVPDLERITQQLFSLFEEQYRDYVLHGAILANLYITGLLGQLSKLFEVLKEEQNLLLISDFHRIVSRVVVESSAPFIYERVGEKYNHILFDEFQDTSELQWTNFIPLLENALSRGHFNLIVGDGKQSIYRWRNGKVEQFVDLPEIAHEHVDGFVKQVFRNAYWEGELKDNYRSAKSIIDFNNALYDHASAWLGDWKKVYDGGAQNVKRTGEGMVEITAIAGKSAADRKPETVAWVVAKVQESLADGYLPGDIAVLTRKKSGELDVIAQALQEAGLPVITSESFLLFNSPKVRWIMSCIAYLMHPQDTPTHIQLIGDTEYLFGGGHTRHEWWPKFTSWQGKEVQVDMPSFFEAHWGNLPSLASFPEMLHLFAGQLAKSCTGGEDEYTECLLEHLHQKVVQENETLSAILKWFQEKHDKLYVAAPSHAEGVQMMTVHKSKGLQFPVVIVPRFASGPQHESLWIKLDKKKYGLPGMRVRMKAELDFLPEVKEEQGKQRLDELNVAYVATTRPEDRLYLALEVSEKLQSDNLNEVMWRHVLAQSSDPMASSVVFGKRELKVQREESKTEKPEWTPTASLHQVPEIQIRFADRTYLGQDMQRKGGDFVHECLSVIRSVEESEEVIVQLSKLRKPLLDDVEYWANVARKVVHHEALRPWFSGSKEVVVEHDLVTPDGKWLRPDRMRLATGAYAILDFKTGAESEEHHEQLREYKRALSVATREEVTAHLFYTLTEKLVEVN